MKLDGVIELLVKFGFTPDYITETLSAYDPHKGFERIKTELFLKWTEMGEPKELKEDYDRISRMRLKSVIREGDQDRDENVLNMPSKITPEEFRRFVAATAGEVNNACDKVVEQFIDFLPNEQKELFLGAVRRKKCGGCSD